VPDGDAAPVRRVLRLRIGDGSVDVILRRVERPDEVRTFPSGCAVPNGATACAR
jgi:hypothetical protein